MGRKDCPTQHKTHTGNSVRQIPALLCVVSSLAPGGLGVISNVYHSNLFYKIISRTFPKKLVFGECQKTSLMISQHWFMLSLVIAATNWNGHKPKRPQTGTATNRNGHIPEQPQTETATDGNGHRPKRPQTEMATNRNGHKLNGHKSSPLTCMETWSRVDFLGQFYIRFCQMHSCFQFICMSLWSIAVCFRIVFVGHLI